MRRRTTGNQLSTFILEKTQSYDMVLYIIMAFFMIATLISMFVVKPDPVDLESEEMVASEVIVK